MDGLLYILAFIILFVLFYLYYLGVFTALTFQETKLGPLKIFYLEYIGEYRQIGSTFGRVSRDISQHFKFARLFGLYYDPPVRVVDPKQTRAIVGVILNSGENPAKEDEFAKAYIQYKKAELPMVEATLTRFPYRNKLTYLLYGKIYNQFSKYMTMKYGRNLEKNAKGGIMEVYYMNKGNSFIEFYWPHGSNSERYHLTSAPKPPYKEDNKED